ncbi:MAG: hypothetical protein ACOYZ6_05275 [Chloroflexota bacterium]
MSEKISRNIMVGELIFQLLSFAWIAVATLQGIIDSYPYFWYDIQFPSSPYFWDNVLYPVMLVVICIGRISEIILSGVFIFDGARGLQNSKPTLWILSAIGLILFIILSIPIPPDEGFVDYFLPLPIIILGTLFSVLVVFIPFVHLILEKQFRKRTSPIS